jgi:hypothetical protein
MRDMRLGAILPLKKTRPAAARQHKKPVVTGVKAVFPGFIELALATSIEKVPDGESFIDAEPDQSWRATLRV